MSGEQFMVAVLIAGAAAFMLRLTWRRWSRLRRGRVGGGCGSGDAPAKHVSLTLDGKTVRR